MEMKRAIIHMVGGKDHFLTSPDGGDEVIAAMNSGAPSVPIDITGLDNKDTGKRAILNVRNVAAVEYTG